MKKTKASTDRKERMDGAPMDARNEVLARIRGSEDAARDERLKLLRRDLKHADVKLHYGDNNFTRHTPVSWTHTQASRSAYERLKSEDVGSVINVLWVSGPGGCYKGEYICIRNAEQFARFVEKNYDGLKLDHAEREKYFQRLLEQVSGAIAEPSDGCYLGFEVDE